MKDTKEYVKNIWDNTDIPSCVDALMDADQAVGTISNDMYEQLSGIAHQMTAEDGHEIKGVQSVFRQFEKEYKKKKGVRAMPSSYRSAKSVVLNALKNGIELTDEWDNPKGKTAIEKGIREAKKQAAETSTARVARLAEESRSKITELDIAVRVASSEDVPSSYIVSHLNVMEQRIAAIRTRLDEIDKGGS